MSRYVTPERKAAASEERIVDPKCLHDWKPDAFGGPLQVCHKCWSTRRASPTSGDSHG